MISRITLFGLALIFLTSDAARAQDALEFAEGSNWRHKWTGLEVPPVVAGFVRGDGSELIPDEYNLAISLTDETSETSATLYVFKPGVESLPIWADRATTAMLSSRSLGDLDLDEVALEPFAPPFTTGVVAGFRVTVPVRNSRNTSTGMTIFALDGWIVKLRMTSTRLDTASLTDRMDAFLAGLTVPTATAAPSTFTMIDECAEKLPFKKKAKIVRMDMMGIILASTAFGTARKKASEELREMPRNWCREAVGTDFAAYRQERDEESFVVAFNDAGITASVAEVDFGGLLSLSDGYYVTVSDGATEEILPPFNHMPNPGQVAGTVGTVGPIASFDLRPGNDGKQTIIVPGG